MTKLSVLASRIERFYGRVLCEPSRAQTHLAFSRKLKLAEREIDALRRCERAGHYGNQPTEDTGG